MSKRRQFQVLNAQEGFEGSSGCCLPPEELAARIEDWRGLGTAGALETSQESGKLILRLRRDPEVEFLLHHLVALERDCCSSLLLDITADPQYLTLEISGPWQETPWSGIAGGAFERPSVDITESVRQRYAALARGLSRTPTPERPFLSPAVQNGCGAAYDAEDIDELMHLPAGLSLGCGNAVAAAELKSGEVVLDLGSGAGLDVLAAARRVGPFGKVYGVDMTDEMLELAGMNQAEACAANVEFLKGYIEDIPLPDGSVNVVISNCVVNLSASKPNVFSEMFRVLGPGGRLAVSDVVSDLALEAAEREDRQAWSSCLAGALTREEYRCGLEQAGFERIDLIESHRVQSGFSSVLVKAAKP